MIGWIYPSPLTDETGAGLLQRAVWDLWIAMAIFQAFYSPLGYSLAHGIDLDGTIRRTGTGGQDCGSNPPALL